MRRLEYIYKRQEEIKRKRQEHGREIQKIWLERHRQSKEEDDD